MPDRKTSSGLLLFQVARFSGVNRRVSKFLIGDDQCQDNLNFTFDERGALSKLTGFVQWNAISLGASKMLGGERFYKTGATNEFIEAHNGSLHKGVDATNTFTQIATGFSTTAKWRMKINRDMLFMLNNVDSNRKWNGTTVTLMGLVAPTTAPTAADGGVGVLSAGAYTWKYTFVSATAESNGSPVSNTLTLAASRQASLTGIAVSTDSQVTKRRIYRTLAGGSSLKFVGEINDNTTTVFTDNVADASLGADIPFDKDPPPIGKYIEAFKNRLWISGQTANPRRLLFSELFEPEAWPATFFVDIPMTPGDEITGIKVLGDVLVVYGHNTPFLIIGETPFDFTVKRSFAQTGTESDRSIALIENTHIYLSRFGVYAFDGAVSRLLSDDIEPAIREIGQSFIANSSAGYHDRKKIYRLAVTNTTVAPAATTSNREYCYDLRTNAWFFTDRTIEYYHHLDGPGDNGELYSASPSIGRLFREDSGESADGATMLCKWSSKAYILGVVDFTKYARHILFWSTPNEDPITLSVEFDDDASKGQTWTIPTNPQAATYGTGIYGTSVYGGPGIARVANVFGRHMFGRYLEIAVESSTDAGFKIYNIEISYRVQTHIRIR